jgi:hypothetical protein
MKNKWKNLPSWVKGGIIGILVTLILSLFNHYVLYIAWQNSPLGIISMIICGLNKCNIVKTFIDWLFLPIIFALIWLVIEKIKQKKS